MNISFISFSSFMPSTHSLFMSFTHSSQFFLLMILPPSSYSVVILSSFFTMTSVHQFTSLINLKLSNLMKIISLFGVIRFLSLTLALNSWSFLKEIKFLLSLIHLLLGFVWIGEWKVEGVGKWECEKKVWKKWVCLD